MVLRISGVGFGSFRLGSPDGPDSQDFFQAHGSRAQGCSGVLEGIYGSCPSLGYLAFLAIPTKEAIMF